MRSNMKLWSGHMFKLHSYVISAKMAQFGRRHSTSANLSSSFLGLYLTHDTSAELVSVFVILSEIRLFLDCVAEYKIRHLCFVLTAQILPQRTQGDFNRTGRLTDLAAMLHLYGRRQWNEIKMHYCTYSCLCCLIYSVQTPLTPLHGLKKKHNNQYTA